MPSFWDILGWILHALLQYILFWVPVLKPYPESEYPPYPWYTYNSWSDWFAHRDGEWRPDEHLIRQYLEMGFGELKRLTLHEAGTALDSAKSWLRGLIGSVRSGYSSLGHWLDVVNRRLGDWLPGWASTVGVGLQKLNELFPTSIRYKWESWSNLFEGIKQSVRDWVWGRYESFRSWANEAINWVRGAGQSIRGWWDRSRDWLDRLRNDPYGTIAHYLGAGWRWLAGFWQRWRDEVLGLLGWDWPRLKAFSQSCLTFYFNLWSQGWATLDSFVRDPRSFIMDRLEQAIMDRW